MKMTLDLASRPITKVNVNLTFRNVLLKTVGATTEYADCLYLLLMKFTLFKPPEVQMTESV